MYTVSHRCTSLKHALTAIHADFMFGGPTPSRSLASSVFVSGGSASPSSRCFSSCSSTMDHLWEMAVHLVNMFWPLLHTHLACGVFLAIGGPVGLKCVGVCEEAGLGSCLRDSVDVEVNVFL